MTARAGKTWSAASVMGGMEASAQPLRAPRSGRMMRAVQAGPLAGLIAQVLLLAVLGGDRRAERHGVGHRTHLRSNHERGLGARPLPPRL
jgi:hypothetical protein